MPLRPLGVAAFIAAAGTANAAENLPALGIDPGLLGIDTSSASAAPATPAGTAAPTPSAAPAASQPQPPAASAPVTEQATAVPIDAPVNAAAPVAAPAAATPNTAKPTAQSAPEPAAVPVPAPTPAPAQSAAAPVVAPPPRQASSNASIPSGARPVSTAINLPPLGVDPGLLGPGVAAVATNNATAPTSATAAAGAHAAATASSQQASTGPTGTISSNGKFNKVPHDPNAKSPIYLTADKVEGANDSAIVATGSVELQQDEQKLTADKVTYWQLDDTAEAEGNVVLSQPGARMSGPKMRMSLEDGDGYFEQPDYMIRSESVETPPQNLYTQLSRPLHPSMVDVTAPQRVVSTGSGHAERIEMEGEGQYHLTNATYSTCPADSQDWYTKVSDLKLDYDREVGEGSNASLWFKGVPILYTPMLSFSLDNQRKTGLLSPTFAVNSTLGLQYYQPWYWNIAPNMDATFTSRMMAKRGEQAQGEVRYLGYNYSGISSVEYLPHDNLMGTSRYAFSVLHNQNLGQGFTGTLNLNGVSDPTYFTDLSTKISSIAQVNLLRQAALNYSAGWWSSSLALEKYQTLQIPGQSAVTVPYASLPRLSLTAARPDLPGGMAFNLQGQFVNFSTPVQSQVQGQRLMVYPQLSLPYQTAAFYVTPKLGVSATTYALTNQPAGAPTSTSRTLPIFSVDSGVTFERDMQWDGKNLTHTLEPRLYYLYVPRRDQSQLPVFDTALADLSFPQIFSENRYVGYDRIGDANQLTAAVTSRLIDTDTGIELIRGMIGQRYYFSDQYVTLPGEVARTGRNPALLAAATGLIAPRTYLDTTWQHSQGSSQTNGFNVMTRWQPEIGKVLNAGYRYTQGVLGQVDISGQWPVSSRWSVLGRYNYSTQDKRLIEGIAGFEYNADCWSIRSVLQQLSTTAQTKSTTFFIQLELRGLSSIGSNPTEVLSRTIPGYGRNYGASITPVGTNPYY